MFGPGLSSLRFIAVLAGARCWPRPVPDPGKFIVTPTSTGALPRLTCLTPIPGGVLPWNSEYNFLTPTPVGASPRQIFFVPTPPGSYPGKEMYIWLRPVQKTPVWKNWHRYILTIISNYSDINTVFAHGLIEYSFYNTIRYIRYLLFREILI